MNLQHEFGWIRNINLKQKRKWQTRLFTLGNFLLCTWILMHVLDRLQIKVFWYYHGTRNTKSTEKTKKWYVWNYTIKRKWNSQWNVIYFLLWTTIWQTVPSMSSDNFDFGDTYGKFFLLPKRNYHSIEATHYIRCRE